MSADLGSAVGAIIKDRAEARRARFGTVLRASLSLRAGFITGAAAHGAVIFKIQVVSRHRTLEYLRSTSAMPLGLCAQGSLWLLRVIDCADKTARLSQKGGGSARYDPGTHLGKSARCQSSSLVVRFTVGADTGTGKSNAACATLWELRRRFELAANREVSRAKEDISAAEARASNFTEAAIEEAAEGEQSAPARGVRTFQHHRVRSSSIWASLSFEGTPWLKRNASPHRVDGPPAPGLLPQDHAAPLRLARDLLPVQAGMRDAVQVGRRGSTVCSSGRGSIPSSWRMWANFRGSAKRPSAIISRSATKPISVKNSRGGRATESRRISPRSTRPCAVVDSFGCRAFGPPLQVLSMNPSATVGSVLMN
jgi:hypothetical protein